jgi:hypothetical protein
LDKGLIVPLFEGGFLRSKAERSDTVASPGMVGAQTIVGSDHWRLSFHAIAFYEVSMLIRSFHNEVTGGKPR